MNAVDAEHRRITSTYVHNVVTDCTSLRPPMTTNPGKEHINTAATPVQTLNKQYWLLLFVLCYDRYYSH